MLLLLGSFATPIVFAQSSSDVSNVNFDFERKNISGSLGSSFSNEETEVYLTDLSSGNWSPSIPESMLIGVLPTRSNSFSLNFDSASGGNTLRPDTSTTRYANIAADNGQEIASYSHILFKNDNVSGGYTAYSLRSLQTGAGATNSVRVNWGNITLQNDQSTGLFYHDITTDGFATRDEGVPVYLNITKSGIGVPNQHITLCVVPDGAKQFILSFPLCAGYGSLQESPIEAGFEYKLFFSNAPNSSYVINAAGGDGVVSLPSVPTPDTTSSNLPVTISNSSAKKSGNKNFFEVQGKVNENGTAGQLLNFSVRKKGSNSGELLAQIPYISTGTNFRIPSAADLASFPGLDSGEYELAINASGSSGLLQDPVPLPLINDGSTGNNSSSSTINYNPTQQTIIQKGIVGSIDCGYKIGKGQGGRVCGFSDFITLIQRVIEYIFILVLPIMAIVFAYAGYLFLTSGGSESKRTAAKKAMTSALIGVIIIMAAWLLVKTVLVSLGVDEGASWFFLAQ